VNGLSLGACAKYFPLALVQFPIELLQNADACGEKSSVNVMKAVALAAEVIEVTAAAITSSPAKANILSFLDFNFRGRPSQYENCARSGARLARGSAAHRQVPLSL
jgi:hypothetical protein